MYISEDVLKVINQLLNQKYGMKTQVSISSSVSGGSINSCYRIKAGQYDFFLKVNSAERYPDMFFKEAEGLKTIRNTGTVSVPEVVACGWAGAEQFLILKWISKGRNSETVQEVFGTKLALMHRESSGSFGLGYDNYMGSLIQKNTQHSSWEAFFIYERLIPQVKMAYDNRLIDNILLSQFDHLYKRLASLFDEEKPSLIHGDLWGGNYMVSEQGEAMLIDPAISYGHREFDMAMTTLFGGFEDSFYSSYNESYPLQKGWEERISLWNLYPLLIHLNLFGASYLSQIKGCLKKFM